MFKGYGKVGVGVITTGIRTLKDYKLEEGVDFFVYTDTDKNGPAYARNRVLEHFDGYDYVFLFDDDCYPTRSGYIEYFINFSEDYGVNFMALPEPFGNPYESFVDEMLLWKNSLGCFTFQTKLALETVGGYNEAYVKYGYEDSYRNHLMTNKTNMSGFSEYNVFPLKGLMYIHSEDVFHENPAPNVSQEDKDFWVAINFHVYNHDLSTGQIFWPYKKEK